MRTATGKVVVNRAMSLDGFIAGPDDEMGWILELGPQDAVIAKVAAATGAMLVGRRTWDVGARMQADERAGTDYPFTGPTFLLTHRPLDSPDPGVTILSGDIGEAVATALAAAGDRNLELLGADVASQAFRRGLVDEILVYVLPVVMGGGVPFSPAGSVKVDLEPIGSDQSGATTILRFRVRK
jgi:dihydrofolate reductase